MTHRLIYLARPVDFGGGDPETLAVVERAKAEIELRGYGWYDPATALGTGALVPGDEARKLHHRAQSLCTATLAILPPGIASIGVPIEVQKAVAGWGMPTAVVGADGSWSIPAGVEQWPWPGPRDVRRTIGHAVGWLLEQPALGRAQVQEPLAFAQVELLPEPGAPVVVSSPRLPTRAYPDDAGMDLYCSETTAVPPGEFRDIPTGLAVELPEHDWGYLTGRSSTLRKLGLLVNPGVIDPGYRGELFAGVWNLTDGEVTVRAGDRIAQLILMTNATRMYRPVLVTDLAPHARGLSGFGSSGV